MPKISLTEIAQLPESKKNINVNLFNRQVCHHIDDRHFAFSFLIRYKGKNI